MNGNGRTPLVKLRWTATVVLIAILTASGFYFRWKQHSLRQSIREIKQASKLVEDSKNDTETRRPVRWIANRGTRRDRALLNMLGTSHSREDFIVREGPRIVWGELEAPAGDQGKLAVYVPTGGHHLKYAVLPHGGQTKAESDRFRHGDTRQLEAVVSIKLDDVPEVYEFVLSGDANEGMQVSLYGSADACIHRGRLPNTRGADTVSLKVPDDSIAFPSEVKPTKLPSLLETDALVVTDLASAFIGARSRGGLAAVRIWIESDALACMNANDLVPLMVPNRLRELLNCRESEIQRVFEPYDGGDRFIFRHEAFDRLRAVNSGRVYFYRVGQ